MKRERTANFGENLRTVLEECGLPQNKFAERVGVSKSTVNNWLTGIREPNFDTLIKIADVLCVPADALLGRGGLPDCVEQAKVLQQLGRLDAKQTEFLMAQMDLIQKFAKEDAGENPQPPAE